MSHRVRIRAEILIVLSLSLGMSALYAIVSFSRRLADQRGLSEQTATLNRSLAEQQVFDLLYQLLGIASALAPVALVVFLLWSPTAPHLGRLGLQQFRPGSDLAWGLTLAAAIGLPGLALYVGGVWAGITVRIVPTGLESYWWTIPVLALSALTAGIVEETIAVGYLTHRLELLGWATWSIIWAQAILRGFYHLYQGVGPFFGNIAMGLVFGWFFLKTRRLAPLIIAHSAIDAVAFIGYPLIAQNVPEILGFAL